MTNPWSIDGTQVYANIYCNFAREPGYAGTAKCTIKQNLNTSVDLKDSAKGPQKSSILRYRSKSILPYSYKFMEV